MEPGAFLPWLAPSWTGRRRPAMETQVEAPAIAVALRRTLRTSRRGLFFAVGLAALGCTDSISAETSAPPPPETPLHESAPQEIAPAQRPARTPLDGRAFPDKV